MLGGYRLAKMKMRNKCRYLLWVKGMQTAGCKFPFALCENTEFFESSSLQMIGNWEIIWILITLDWASLTLIKSWNLSVAI